MASTRWSIELNQETDDLGTSLMPDEILVKGDVVKGLYGVGLKREIELHNAVNELTPKDIVIKRHRGEFSDGETWKAVSVQPV